jgi:tetratricopeptide (TPR) repeat protein
VTTAPFLLLAVLAQTTPPPQDGAVVRFEAAAQAVRDLQAAIRRDPARESNYTELGNLLLKTSNFAEAILVLEHARPRFPESAQLALSLGVAYYGQRRFDDAAQAFLDTARLDPDAPQPVMFLSRMADQLERHRAAAEAAAGEFVRRQPASYWGHYLKGRLAGDETALRKAIEIEPRFADGHFALASLLESRRDFAGAAREFEKAAALNPSSPAPHYRLMRVYSRLGQPENADAARLRHERLTAAEKQELDRRQAGTKRLDLKVQP